MATSLLTNLESHWEFESDVLDTHGSNNLTANGSPTYGTGKIGTSALDLEVSSGQSASIADNASMSTGDVNFAFAGWFQLESKGANRTLLGKWNATGDQREYLLFYDNAADRFRWFVSALGTAASNASVQADNFGSPSTGVWYLVVVWHDATNNVIGIQINNGTANTTSHSAGVFDWTSTFYVGSQGASGQEWDGLVDSLSFWKGKVLTADEKTELYQGGSGLDYPFSDPPILQSATINSAGTTLTLMFDESVTGSTAPTLTASSGVVTATYSSGDGTTSIVFSLSRTVYQGETVTLDYAPGNWNDLVGNAWEALSGAAVTNNSTQAQTAASTACQNRQINLSIGISI